MRYIAALLLVLTLSANAEIEVGVGRSEFCCLQDGIWWQSPWGFTGSLRDTSLEIGYRQRFGNWSLYGGYVDLGEASGSNTAVMRDDEFGKYNTAQPCDTNLQKNCLGYFNTNQHIAGILAGGSYSRVLNGVRLETELGYYFYRSDLAVNIWCPNCGVGSKYAFGGEGTTFSSASEIRRSTYISLRASYKQVFVAWRRFTKIDGGGSGLEGVEEQFSIGLTNGPVNQIVVGVTM